LTDSQCVFIHMQARGSSGFLRPFHIRSRDIPIGTLRSIEKQSGLKLR
jgi:predicted RNA binding protein YcfA (HicA-like mRNA interferase family)